MGIVHGGPPHAWVGQIQRKHPCAAFVETGTFKGNTTRWASEIFPQVHTIEKFRRNYEEARASLADRENVTCHQGDSAEILPGIVKKYPQDPLFFWLDAHFCGTGSAGESGQCPLLGELDALRNRPGDVILIDDARLFLSAPPPPNKPEEWPGIREIWEHFRSWPSPRFLQVIDDIIFAVPEMSPWKEMLLRFSVSRADAFWHHYGWISKKKTWKEKAGRFLPGWARRHSSPDRNG